MPSSGELLTGRQPEAHVWLQPGMPRWHERVRRCTIDKLTEMLAYFTSLLVLQLISACLWQIPADAPSSPARNTAELCRAPMQFCHELQ